MREVGKMKLLIFGSTGSIGRQLVWQALEQGHTVTAFTRNPAKLDDIQHANLKVIQGDVMDLASVEKAVQGQDAVLCSLGAGSKGTIRSQGTRHIIRAMEKVGVRRLICQTTLGVGESWGNLNFFWKYIMFGFLLRQAYADHVAQENYVKQSHLDWTIVRPGAFVDGERTGNYRHGFPGTDRTSKLKISRADVADFMLKQLTDDLYLHKTPALSY
nr:SDR family oxidoreductase [Chroococcidiopsis sp. SAG 2025]